MLWDEGESTLQYCNVYSSVVVDLVSDVNVKSDIRTATITGTIHYLCNDKIPASEI